MTTLTTKGAGETEAVGEAIGLQLRVGDLVVLTGDLDAGAFDAGSSLLAPAAAMELPSHGAFRPDLVQAVRAVRPDALVEPADATRVVHDRWQPLLGGAVRGITARDGALRLQVDADGHARSWHWTGDRWIRG